MQRGIAIVALAAIAAVALVLPRTASASQIGFTLTETDNGGIESLSTNLAGALITGTTDNWQIDLSGAGVGGIIVSSLELPTAWVEAPGDSGCNVVSVVSAHVLGLTSETALPDNFCSTGNPLAQGVTWFIGRDTAQNSYFVTVEEQTAVPEPASMALFGTALVGLGALRRRRRNA